MREPSAPKKIFVSIFLSFNGICKNYTPRTTRLSNNFICQILLILFTIVQICPIFYTRH